MRKLTLLAAALACTVALPARADLAADFAATSAFFGLEEFPDRMHAYAAQLEMIPQLAGTWLSGDILLPSYDPEVHARWCGREPVRIVPAGAHSFDMIRVLRDGRELPARYASVGGWGFVRHTDPDAVLAYQYGDRLASTDPALRSVTLVGAGHENGPVILHLPNPDLLVIEAPGHPVRMLLRCPG